MKIILFALALTMLSCGDNNSGKIDGGVKHDGGTSDAAIPAAPALGPQIDRLGRPAVNTVLNHGFDGTAAAGPAKDAYNQDQALGTWPTTYAPAFMTNLAIVDALDTGLKCVDGGCTPEAGGGTPGDGCGNQPLYAKPASAASYAMLAGILADDELYLDTGLPAPVACDIPASHQNYLAVEIDVVTQGVVTNATCGGRAPTNDVIDTSYTALAIGLTGFKATDGSFQPAVGDGVGPHADVSNDTFPFLGAPH